MAYNLMKHLSETNNIELSAILLNEGKLYKKLRDIGIKVDVVDEAKYGFMKIIMNTRELLSINRPDIVHSHRYKENIVAYLSSVGRNKIRLVSTQHGMPEQYGNNIGGKYSFLQKVNFWIIANSFQKLVAVSSDIKNALEGKMGFSDRLVTVIRNGTEIPLIVTSKKAKDFVVVGSMGRFFPVKDFPFMVEIAKILRIETDKIKFELAGDGPDENIIIEMIKKYRLENVFCLRGFLENVEEYFMGIDIYLNTSIHEGIPLSILEAMSYGIPVIAPDVGGIKEIIKDGSEGYLIKKRDPKLFADKCFELYKNSSLRASMGVFGREKIEREFSNGRMAREYERLYVDLAS